MMNKNLTKKKKKGFTLIELIVVIAILGILAAVAIPKLGGFQDSAKKQADVATAKTIATATATLIADQKITVTSADQLVNINSSATDTNGDKIEAFMQSVPQNKYGQASWTVVIKATTGEVHVIANTSATAYATAAAAEEVKDAEGLYPAVGSSYK